MENKIILFERKEDCCGCYACYSICPKEAIYFEADEEGFEYPKIDKILCIQCGACLGVCPIRNKK